MRSKLILLLPMFLLVSVSTAQQICGKISDIETGEPLEGFVVSIYPINKKFISSHTGEFLFDSLKVGVYQITVQGLGYDTYISQEIWVKSNKSTFYNFLLTPKTYKYDEIVIKAEKWPLLPGIRNITEEQVSRFAATYADPARLFLTSPDAAVSHDQNNQISIRGLSPDWNTWRINGAEVVNPNHLSNAGTALDQPTANGGGVNALSAQMLEVSTLHFGNINFGIANQSAGVFDLHIKDGNPTDTQYTTIASLLGFDGAISTPLNRESNLTLSANYRYSFTGLLGLMGIRFNGEKISFQDFAFQLTKKTKSSTTHRFYSFVGLNSNLFQDSTQQEINFYSQLGLIGYQFNNPKINYTLNYSFHNFQREEIVATISPNSIDLLLTQNKMNKSLLSQNFEFIHKKAGLIWRIGGILNIHMFSPINGYIASRPFTTVQFIALPNVELNVGTGWAFEKNKWSDKPDVKLSFKFMKNQNIWEIYSGIHSQNLYSYDQHFIYQLNYSTQENWEPKLVTSYKSGLTFSTLLRNWQVSSDFFHQYVEEFQTPIFNKRTTQKTVGISLNINRNFDNYFYVLGGISIFSSKWLSDISNPNDSQYSASWSIGRSLEINTKEKKNTLDFHFKTLHLGKRMQSLAYNSPLDQTVWLIGEESISPYFRLDAKISLKSQKTKLTSYWALDIQNVLNKENEGYVYFDELNAELRNSLQLGMVPILAYRLDF